MQQLPRGPHPGAATPPRPCHCVVLLWWAGQHCQDSAVDSRWLTVRESGVNPACLHACNAFAVTVRTPALVLHILVAYTYAHQPSMGLPSSTSLLLLTLPLAQ
jgi:hypothetical protein